MSIKVDPLDEWKAGGAGAVKAALLKYLPGLDVALADYDEVERRRRQKALEEFRSDVLDRQGRLEDRGRPDWLGSEEGQVFAGKVLDAALDAQMVDRRQFFANALVNGAHAGNMPYVEKSKFVDLLLVLSRVALDVLAELHRMFAPILRKPPHARTESTFLDMDRISQEIASRIGLDPYLVSSAMAELASAGLFSGVTNWRRDAEGKYVPAGAWLRGVGYTDFTERFVRFIMEPA